MVRYYGQIRDELRKLFRKHKIKARLKVYHDNIEIIVPKKNKYYDSPYNTYCHYGIPPTAICNPGAKSIIAALLPQSTSYLYYVSKNDGWHSFSRTYKEHQLKVYKYQKRRR